MPAGFSTATLAAGGTLGILIPPSVVLVIYAILTEQNIAKLFLSAFIPGPAGGIGLCDCDFHLRPPVPGKRGHPPAGSDAATALPRCSMSGRCCWCLVWLSAAFTWAGSPRPRARPWGPLAPASSPGLNGGLNRETLADSFLVTARSTAMIFFIVLGAGFYKGFLALTKVPQELADLVVSQGLSPWMVLALILAFYLVFGCLMDSLSMILLTIPIFFPVISALDFGLLSLPAMQADAAMEVLKAGVPEGMGAEMLASIQDAIATGAELTREQMKELGIRVTEGRVNRIEAEYVAIWFGVLVLIVVEVGLITPPVGMNLFIINAMDRKTRMIDTYKAVMFFVASDIVRVIILVAFPVITLLPLMLMY